MLKIKCSSTPELPWIAIPLKSHLVSAGPMLQSTRPYSKNMHHPVLKDPEPALPEESVGCAMWLSSAPVRTECLP